MPLWVPDITSNKDLKMKKIINALLITLGLSFLITLSGCYGTVYYDTINDVVSEKATISGIINSITRYTAGGKEFLVINATNGIRYKPYDNDKHGGWKNYSSLPFDLHSYDYYNSQSHKGEQIVKIVSDENYLYVVTVSYKNDYEEGTSVPNAVKIWAKQISLADDGTTWSTDGDWVNTVEDNSSDILKFYTYNSYVYSAFSVFATNSVQKEHRSAYIRSGDADALKSSYKTVTYYKLNGQAAPQEITATVADSSTSNACSAVYYNGDVLFFNSVAATTNETSTSDATRLYYGHNSSGKHYVYYNETAGGVDFVSAGFDAGTKIMSLAVCADSLLIGKGNYTSTSTSAAGGLIKTSLTDGIPGKSIIAFSTNADVQLPTSYFVICLLNVSPELAEEETILYASTAFLGNSNSTSASYNNLGLWSYYPKRGNWNRE